MRSRLFLLCFFSLFFALLSQNAWAEDEAAPAETAATEAPPAEGMSALPTGAPEPGLEPTPPPPASPSPPPAVADAAKAGRPMSQMDGKCANYALDLSREFKRWEEPAFVVRAGTTPDSAGPLESGKRMEITLERENKVRLAVAPEKPSKYPASVYGGLVRFRVPKDGTYRVAAGNRLWLEVVNARLKQRIPEASFEMQTKCPTIAKVIVYDLKASDNYWLQLSNSEAKRAEVLVFPAP